MADLPVAPCVRAEAIWFLTYAGILSSWTFVPILAKDLGIDDTSIGIAVTLYAVALLLASYVFGRASDVHGRQRYILGGLLLGAVGMTVHLLIGDVASLWLIRTLTGFALGVYPAALIDYIARGTGRLGRFSAWGSLGWGVGTLGGGLLAYYYDDLTMVFLFAATLFFVSFLLALNLPPVKEVRQHVPLFPKALILRNLPYYLPFLIRHLGAMGIWAYWPLFLTQDLGASYLWVGIIQFVNPVTQFFFMYAFTDRARIRVLFPVGLLLSIFVMFSFTLARNVWELLPTQVLLGVSWGCTYVGALRSVTEGSEEKATASGLLNSVTSLSAVLGPAVSTVLVSVTHDYEAPMYLASGLAAVSLVLHYVLRGRFEEGGEVSASTSSTSPGP